MLLVARGPSLVVCRPHRALRVVVRRQLVRRGKHRILGACNVAPRCETRGWKVIGPAGLFFVAVPPPAQVRALGGHFSWWPLFFAQVRAVVPKTTLKVTTKVRFWIIFGAIFCKKSAARGSLVATFFAHRTDMLQRQYGSVVCGHRWKNN